MYKRILIKLSGEVLSGESASGINPELLGSVCEEIRSVSKLCQVALVIGAGNLFRGKDRDSMPYLDTVTADTVGMLGTVSNGLILQAGLRSNACSTSLLSASHMPVLCEQFTRDKGIEALTKNTVVICVGGTGNPFFTTDTAAVVRALELDCDILLKATKVDGVYSDNPKSNPAATRFMKLTYTQAIADNLEVMDMTALALAMKNNLQTIVFDFFEKGNLAKVATGEKIGTLITT